MRHISDHVFPDSDFEPTLRTLLFTNPVFHNGINVTCRSGYKWADSLGEIVKIEETGNEGERPGRYGHILGVMTVKLNKIPETVLAMEHDPSCRTQEGIIKEMKRVYGEDLPEDAPTTVLFFELENEVQV